ncbi:MAG: NADPH:quinone reductase [Desulfobacterales bacterium]|nr:NADPH:quinone reductase [Desulfobacterales bacterium]
MKAIRVHQFGEPESMALEEIAEPEPESGQVRLQIAAAGVNPVDTYIRAGTYHIRPNLPYTPGNDGTGRIDAVGQGVSHLKVGDRVYCAGSLSGTYAEKALCASARVFPLPETLSYAQGASVGVPYGAAYHGLFHRAKALPGETVLVHGATGGVGTAAVQLAKAHGMTVAATGGTEQGRRQAAEQGADLVLNHKSTGYLEQLMAWTHGRGVDVILEMLANVNLGEDLKVLAANGRVVVIGSRGTVEINPRDAMQKNAAILGMLLGSVSAEEFRRIHAALGAGMASNVVKPLVDRELPLAQAPEAHRRFMEAGAAGQIVLVP